MTLIKKILTCCILCLSTFAQANAQADSNPSRPVLSVYSLEIGGARNLSTYLSPLYYSGTSYALSGSWTKDFNHWSDRCEMRFESSLNFDNLLNPAETARMYGMTAHFGWGLSWRKAFATDWKFTLGPMVDLYGGALYIPRNGNNPATALASAGIDIAGSLSWRGKFGKLPVCISDEITVPTMSGFFSPGYGEPYYEIYLGNRKGLAHFGWWGNNFSINNLLSLRFNFGKTGMSIGYRLDLRTFKANNLQTQVLRNAFVIGVIPNL